MAARRGEAAWGLDVHSADNRDHPRNTSARHPQMRLRVTHLNDGICYLLHALAASHPIASVTGRMLRPPVRETGAIRK